jgi:hypothetical protein
MIGQLGSPTQHVDRFGNRIYLGDLVLQTGKYSTGLVLVIVGETKCNVRGKQTRRLTDAFSSEGEIFRPNNLVTLASMKQLEANNSQAIADFFTC